MFASWKERNCLGSAASTLLLLAGVVSISAGCVQEMADQPRIDTLEESRFFSDGLGARPQVPGTVSHDQQIEETPLTTGMEGGKPVQRIPVELSDKLLKRGRERYGIYCRHCHGPAGYGDGMVVQRGFPAPPSYHIERLETAPDGHLFQAVTQGFGRMPAFGSRIKPDDRWAIVAYVRALQLSQNAPLARLSTGDRRELGLDE